MKIEVLVPCMKLDEKGIVELFHFLNIQTDVLFACQCDKNAEESLVLNNHNVHIVYSRERGVSKNRNLLLAKSVGDVLLMIDDDCVLTQGYEQIIVDAYKKFPKATAIRFNTTRIQNGRHCKMIESDKKLSFKDLSAFGTPGLSIKKSAFVPLEIHFDENLGAPNYLANGEDSLFLFELVKKSKAIYSSKNIIAHVHEDRRESTWFKGYNDAYFVTKGYVFSKMYPHIYKMVARYHYHHQKEQYRKSGYDVKKYMKLIKQGHYYKGAN